MSEIGQQIFLGDKEVSIATGNLSALINPFKPGLDADAKAFLDAAQIYDEQTKKIVNDLVVNLKNANLWTKLVALWPFVGGTAYSHKWNLIDPQDLDSSFRLTFAGTLTHSVNGVEGDGSTGYYDTHIVPNTDIARLDNTGFVYTRKNIQEDKISGYGVKGYKPVPGTNLGWWQIGSVRDTSNQYVGRNMFAPPASGAVANTNGAGFFSNTRTTTLAVEDFTLSINKSHTTFTQAADDMTGNVRSIYGLAFSETTGAASLFSANQHAFGGFTNEALTTSEINTLVDINQSFQTALGRFV